MGDPPGFAQRAPPRRTAPEAKKSHWDHPCPIALLPEGYRERSGECKEIFVSAVQSDSPGLTSQCQECGLEGVLGIGSIAQHSTADPQHHGTVAGNQPGEGFFVAGDETRQQGVVRDVCSLSLAGQVANIPGKVIGTHCHPGLPSGLMRARPLLL
jgi:hypothetical protein